MHRWKREREREREKREREGEREMKESKRRRGTVKRIFLINCRTFLISDNEKYLD